MPIRQPSLRRLLVVWALLGFSYFGIQTVLQNLYLLRLGYGTEFIGVLIGSGQVLWAVCALPAGYVGRRFGLRRAILAGWILSGLGNSLVVFVEFVPPEWRMPWLFFWWGLSWVGAALNSVNNIPYVMAVASPEERNYAFAAQQGIQSLMAFVGSLVAGLLPGTIAAVVGPGDSLAPFRYTLWLVPLGYALIVLVIVGIEPAAEPVHQQRSANADKAPLGLFALFVIVVFLQTTGDGSLRAFFNVYLDRGLGVSTAQIGSVMGLAQLLPVIGAILAPRVLSALGPARAYGAAALAGGLFIVVVALVPNWLVAAAAYTGAMTVFSIAGPARNVFSQQLVVPRWRTTSAALSTIGLATGWAATAMAGGYAIAMVGFPGLFGASALLAATSAMTTLLYLRHRVQRVD